MKAATPFNAISMASIVGWNMVGADYNPNEDGKVRTTPDEYLL